VTKLTVAFRNFANAPRTACKLIVCMLTVFRHIVTEAVCVLTVHHRVIEAVRMLTSVRHEIIKKCVYANSC